MDCSTDEQLCDSFQVRLGNTYVFYSNSLGIYYYDYEYAFHDSLSSVQANVRRQKLGTAASMSHSLLLDHPNYITSTRWQYTLFICNMYQVTSGATALFPPGSSLDQQGSILVRHTTLFIFSGSSL